MIWEITNAEIVNPGQTVVTDEGTLVTGFVIEAKAKAKHDNVVPEGKIVMTLSAFSPAREMPGQQPGVWYIQGEWIITKKGASPESAKARYSSDKAQGSLQAELAFNPLTGSESWSGLAWIPMSPTAGRWSKGQGSITMSRQFEGDLLLDLSQLPELEQ